MANALASASNAAFAGRIKVDVPLSTDFSLDSQHTAGIQALTDLSQSNKFGLRWF